MIEYPNLPDVLLWLLTGALAIVLLVKSWPMIRRAVTTGDAIGGLPQMMVEIHHLQDSVAGLATQVQTIHHEVTPNGGGSAKDAINRTEAAVLRIETRQNAHANIVAAVIEGQTNAEKAMVRLHERIDGKADKQP